LYQRKGFSKSRCQFCDVDFVSFYFAKPTGNDRRPSGGRICHACYNFLKREGKSTQYKRYSYASTSKSIYIVGSGQTRKGYRY
jgi:hypothetical protein